MASPPGKRSTSEANEGPVIVEGADPDEQPKELHDNAEELGFVNERPVGRLDPERRSPAPPPPAPHPLTGASKPGQPPPPPQPPPQEGPQTPSLSGIYEPSTRAKKDAEQQPQGNTKPVAENTQLLGRDRSLLRDIADTHPDDVELQKLAEAFEHRLQSDVLYTSNWHAMLMCAWQYLLPTLLTPGREGVELRAALASSIPKHSNKSMLEAGNDHVALNNFLSALSTFVTKGGRKKGFGTGTALSDKLKGVLSPLVAKLEDLDRRSVDLVREGRAGIGQSALRLAASEIERTLVDTVEKKLLRVLLCEVLGRLEDSERAVWVENKMDITSALNDMVNSSLVALPSSPNVKVPGLRVFAQHGEKTRTRADAKAAILDSKKVKLVYGGRRSKTDNQAAAKHPVELALEVPREVLTGGLEFNSPARSLMVALLAQTYYHDVCIVINPTDGRAAIDCANFGPIDFGSADVSAASPWALWANAVKLDGGGKALLEFARKLNLAPPAGEGARVYDSMITHAHDVVRELRAKVMELHPHRNLLAWPLSTRNSSRNTQLSFSVLLLALLLRESSDRHHKLFKREPTLDWTRDAESPSAPDPQTDKVLSLRKMGSSLSGTVHACLGQFANVSPMDRRSVASLFARKAGRLLAEEKNRRVDEARHATKSGQEREVMGIIAPAFESAASGTVTPEMLAEIVRTSPQLLSKAAKYLEVPQDGAAPAKRAKAEPSDEAAHEPMDAERCFRVEVYLGTSNEPLFTLVRQVSSRDAPDKTLLSFLRTNTLRAAQERGLDGLTELVLKAGTFSCSAPSFTVTSWFFWESKSPCVLRFKPFSLEDFLTTVSLGPSPSYGVRFAVLNAQALHDLWRRTIQAVKPTGELLARLAQYVHDHCGGKLTLPPPALLAEHLNVQRVFLTSNNKEPAQVAEVQAAILLCSTNQLQLLCKMCGGNFRYRGYQTNGIECRVVMDVQDTTFKTPGTHARVNEKDDFQAKLIEQRNARLRDIIVRDFGVEVPVVGAAALDAGMNSIEVALVTASEAKAMASARQIALNAGDDVNEDAVREALRLPNDDGDDGRVLDFHKRVLSFGLSLGQVQLERRTSDYQRKIAIAKNAFEANLEANDRERLNRAGGLSGDAKLNAVPLDELQTEVKRFLDVFDLRIKHYRHKLYREQRFWTRVATESLAGRFFRKLLEMARHAAEQTVPWSGRPDDWNGSLPGKTHYDRRARNHPRVAAQQEQPLRQEALPWPAAFPPPRFAELKVVPGDWTGVAPGRHNTAMPRKAFVRRLRKLVCNYASEQRALSTGMIIGWEPTSEYRSSLQSPQPLQLVLGHRVDRFNPPSHTKDPANPLYEHVAKHRPWKLLVCPITHCILQRDVSAAWAIALQVVFRRAARAIGLPPNEHTLPGYRRIKSG